MAQPEIVKDIDARVKIPGDTMTGSLTAPLFIGSLQGNATTATKLGTSTIGSRTKPIYLDSGTATDCTYELGANIKAYSGSLSSGGWAALNGKSNGSSITIAYNNSSASWNSGTYSASLVFGCQDTRGLLDCAYSIPIVTFGGCSTGGSSNDSPTWYMKLSGTNGRTYTLPTESKILCASDGTNASGTWGINITGKATQDSNGNIIASTYLPLSGGTINGNITVNGNVWYKGLRMQSYEITVGGDLNTYYPVAVDSYLYGNTEAIIITVSKALNTTSPAWPGNHNGGTSSLMASYLVRNNGWDGNGNFVYSITPPQQWYAQVLSHVELRQSAAHHLVFWLRGGGATYRIAANIPTTINVYLSETNLGNSSYPSNVSPRTDIGNAGWLFESPVYLPIKGGTVDGTIRANNVYGAVWNDYAEYRKAESIEPGRVVIESADGEMKLSTKRLQPGAEIISDTFGFAIGETDEYKTPIAATGRVLAYPNEDRSSYPLGCAVCSGPNGTVSQMTREEIREYPERIIGTVSEIPEYKNWGTGNVEVNNRIWIRIK